MIHPNIQSLYKYRPFDAYTLQNIANETLWVSLPSSFNDPFDCSLYIDESKISEAVKGALRIKKCNSDIIDDPNFKVTQYEKELFLKCRNDMNRVFRNAGILSLSQDYKNILMWSHYANNHTGLCIEYERLKSNSLGLLAYPVKYCKATPSLLPSDITSYGNNFDDLWLTKSLDWEYEQEWRLLLKRGGINYNCDCKIKSIIFGMRMHQENREALQNILKNKQVTYKEAIRHESNFELIIKNVQ